ncbi:MAG: sugar phosphate nucleotidyltransferase [Planctomycetia bacterium]
MKDIVTAILGGGAGTRLYPLTRGRAKPAVPLAGKFRLIDVPVSNSLHAGADRIYVLTQFQSESLNRHLAQTYRFDTFRPGFVDVLAAQQGLDDRSWYQGTADAVRQNLQTLASGAPRDVLVLSGDQLYLMDLRAMAWRHRAATADLTIAVTPVPREQAPAFGIMQVDGEGRIVRFVEKPSDPALLDQLAPDPEALGAMGLRVPPGWLLASTGIYAFRRQALQALLAGTAHTDFGRDVIPAAIGTHRVVAFAHTGYWRDIGTIPSFHEANLDLTLPLPPLNLYSPEFPIYTHPRFLPGTKVNRCEVHQSILCEGSIISDSRISESIVGIRAIVRQGAQVERSIVMGAREYEHESREAHEVPLGIGRDCRLRNVIVDLNARIGEGCVLENRAGVQELDGDGVFIRGGIIVVTRDAVVPAGTVL